MIRIAVCEDEKVYLEHLSKYLDEYFQKAAEEARIDSFPDGGPFLEALRKGSRWDIVFMDIQLETSDGIETAKKLREYDRTVPVIFVTGLEDRVFEGYEVAALDYVVKTDIGERLFKALDRFMAGRGAETLLIPVAGGGTTIARYADILWLQSEGRGTLVGTGAERVHSSMPVGQLAGKLPENGFVELHKSVYARTGAIRRIDADTVEMVDGTQLPLSRRRRKAVMAAVMDEVKGR